MTPEEVPAELMRLGENALVKHDSTVEVPYLPTYEERIRAVLAAVLPEHEKQVRAKVAEEIEAATPPDPRGSALPNFVGAGMKTAARIARGEGS